MAAALLRLKENPELRVRLAANGRRQAMAEHAEIAGAIRRRALPQAEAVLTGHILRREGSYWDFLLGQGRPPQAGD